MPTTAFPRPPYTITFDTPGPGQEVTPSAAGEITASGSLSGLIGDPGEIEPAGLPKVSVTVTLTLGGHSLVKTIKTDDDDPPSHEAGGWITSFPVAQSGPATITVDYYDAQHPPGVHDSVDFSVKVTQRLPISVELQWPRVPPMAAPVTASGASIGVPETGIIVTVLVTTPSPTDYVEIEPAAGTWFAKLTQTTKNSEGQWEFGMTVPGSEVPRDLSVLVREWSVNQATETRFIFHTIDITAPTIDVSYPPDDQLIAVSPEPTPANPFELTVTGRVTDTQSEYKSGLYSFDGTDAPLGTLTNGEFSVKIYPTSYGPHTVTISATDNSSPPNTSTVVRLFELASTYKPKTIEELLSPRSYLDDLLRFVETHVLDGNNDSVDTQALKTMSLIDFGTIAEPGSSKGARTENELRFPVALLRELNSLAAGPETTGLIARYPFDEGQGGDVQSVGPFVLGGGLGTGVTWGGKDTELEGALDFDGNGSIGFGPNAVLDVGRNDSDFSVCFWIYPRTTGAGDWREVVFKGHQDDTGYHRTFSIWLFPNANQVHYRISTDKNDNDGGNSVQEVRVNQWTHLTYVKRGNMLRLFLDGELDSEVKLLDPNDPTKPARVIANSDALLLGASPYYSGFDGALDDLRIYGFALSPEDIEVLALDRSSPVPNETPLRTYVRTAYETLLVGLGTSYEEMRVLPPKGTDERHRLAERLGLLAPGDVDDYLDVLLLPTALTDPQREEWLVGTFNLSSTATLLAEPSPWGPGGFLGNLRQLGIGRRWLKEDAASDRAPYLEPDLVDVDDLSTTVAATRMLLKQRQAELEDKFEAIRTILVAGAAGAVEAALHLVFVDKEIAALSDLEEVDASGYSITEALTDLSLSFAAFRRVRSYQKLAAPLSERESDDLANLLTQVWKVRDRYTPWREEEQTLSLGLWPTPQSDGEFVIGNYKRSFLPWRGDIQARIDFEQSVAGRLDDWQALLSNHEQALLDAQRIALPAYRDGLLGIADLPSASDRMDQLTQRLLVDVASDGAITLTMIDHATLSLQSLVNGVRSKFFEPGHPAHWWTLQDVWSDYPQNDSEFAYFDEEWTWLSNFGAWRAALLIYLYPENGLLPDLRLTSSPYPISGRFTEMLSTLRSSNLTSSKADNIAEGYKKDDTSSASNLSEIEKQFFLPVAIAFALEGQGLFTLALDWYGKVFDTSRPPAARALTEPLIAEQTSQEQAPRPFRGARWSLDLDPYRIADSKDSSNQRLWPNPYTRFILWRIVKCITALADGEFARGTLDAREHARLLYLEAKQILAFPELRDLQPVDPAQAYLPNPVFAALRMHVGASLRKLRLGLTYAGAPMPPDMIRGAGASQLSTLVRPTVYPYKVLVERSRQLGAQAQNLETQYLAAIEKRDGEEEKLRRESDAAQIAEETVSLRSLQQTEALDGVSLANLQKARTQIQRDRYYQWLSAGPNQNEREQVEMLWHVKDQRDKIAFIDANIASNSAATSVGAAFWNYFAAGLTTALSFGRGGEQIAANQYETQAQVSSILASQERRQDEWQLQLDLVNKDLVIGNQQILLANDRANIAAQDYLIATTQYDQTVNMLKFLSTKFTSQQFYDWLQGVLGEIYATFLRMATTVARQAEEQLEFQRQQSIVRIIKQDYWAAASDWNPTSTIQSTPDRRGVTGSARLLQDIATLDQYAFDSEKRLLNLIQTFSLSRLFPIEFEDFRQTGVLSFATTLGMFDEGFPGHYVRLLKKVRVSVIALIPPTLGIRASLSTGGLFRVVTGDPGFPTVVSQQDPQTVALSSPAASTGVFELDAQSDLLYPFEGMGVDANWLFELPPAGNPFDFDTLFDVLVTFEYTALSSSELRDRVVKQLSGLARGDLARSVRRDLPDIWYDLSNNDGEPMVVSLKLEETIFPPHLSYKAIEEVLVAVRMTEGEVGAVTVTPSYVASDGTTVIAPVAVPLVNGVASSRQSGAAIWRSTLLADAYTQTGHVPYRQAAASGAWSFAFEDWADGSSPLRDAFQNGTVDDIMLVFTYSGLKPAWAA